MTESKKSIKIDLSIPDVATEIPVAKNTSTNKSEDKKNKFYLPVLNLNNKEFWQSKPMEERQHWTDKKAYETCVGNCCGVSGLKAGCCQLDPNDLEHVLGPVDDDDIKLIIKDFQKRGIIATREDIVIDFEEGKLIGEAFFNGHEVFKNPKSYPFMRFQVYGPRFACKFLSTKTGKCTIYHARPKMCHDYLCQYVVTNFLIRTPEQPNTYKKIR